MALAMQAVLHDSGPVPGTSRTSCIRTENNKSLDEEKQAAPNPQLWGAGILLR